MIVFARQLRTTRDPGVLYRRFIANVHGLETIQIVGTGVPYHEELYIRHTVSVKIRFDRH